MGGYQDRNGGGADHSLTPSERRHRLLGAVGRLSTVDSIDELVVALRGCARSLAGADGIAIVHRERDEVRYVTEDAMAPLWSGQRFPVEACVSGLAMIANEPILIPDIYADARVPVEAYRSTFVRSMAVFPIGIEAPLWAIGAYWATVGAIDAETVTLMTDLARSASFAVARASRPPAGARVRTPISALSL